MAQPTLNDVRWINFKANKDGRGILVAAEAHREIPFVINRIFYMYNNTEQRGEHAHQNNESVLIAFSGSVDVELSTPTEKQVYHLDDPTKGLYMPAMVFNRVYFSSPDAVCLVLASVYYDEMLSYRSWESYVKAVQND